MSSTSRLSITERDKSLGHRGIRNDDDGERLSDQESRIDLTCSLIHGPKATDRRPTSPPLSGQVECEGWWGGERGERVIPPPLYPPPPPPHWYITPLAPGRAVGGERSNDRKEGGRRRRGGRVTVHIFSFHDRTRVNVQITAKIEETYSTACQCMH